MPAGLYGKNGRSHLILLARGYHRAQAGGGKKIKAIGEELERSNAELDTLPIWRA